WVPSQWFCQLAATARKEGRIHDDLHLKSLIDDCLEYRGQCGMIWSYDWISVPLVYTQDAKVPAAHSIDFYVPIFSMFQFFFYVGCEKTSR
ncbi:hypothetical protein OSTOST_23284, partial [Ostertagia ostertagi]